MATVEQTYIRYGIIIILISLGLLTAYDIRQRLRKRKVKKEITTIEAGSKKETLTDETIYGDNFKKWVQGLPDYCVSDTPMHRMYRGMLERFGGVIFQQHVLVDTQGGNDHQFFAIRKGNKFVHQDGTYFHPKISKKDIEYHFLGDCRPIIEQANDVDWKNPEMCSDVVTGAINRAYQDKDQTLQEKILIIVLAVIGIIALGALIVSYSGSQQEMQHYQQTYSLIQYMNNTMGH